MTASVWLCRSLQLYISLISSLLQCLSGKPTSVRSPVEAALEAARKMQKLLDWSLPRDPVLLCPSPKQGTFFPTHKLHSVTSLPRLSFLVSLASYSHFSQAAFSCFPPRLIWLRPREDDMNDAQNCPALLTLACCPWPKPELFCSPALRWTLLQPITDKSILQELNLACQGRGVEAGASLVVQWLRLHLPLQGSSLK